MTKKRKRDGYISPPAVKTQEQLESYTLPIKEAAVKSALAVNNWSPGQTLKIVSWNCDGIDQYLSTDHTSLDKFVTRQDGSVNTGQPFLQQFLTVHEPDVLCLQEVHVPLKKRSSLIRRLREDAPNYEATCCLPASNRHAGVVTLCRKGLSLDTSEVSWDHEGRILVHELDGFFILNVYCLNSSDYPWRDVNGHVHGTRAERKRAFQRLLAKEMTQLSNRKPIVALGDFNISRYSIDATPGTLRTQEPHALNRKEFNALFSDFKDVVREAHPTSRKYTWHSRTGTSEARVDMIFATRGLVVTSCDTLQDAARGASDHSPLYLKVDCAIR